MRRALFHSLVLILGVFLVDPFGPYEAQAAGDQPADHKTSASEATAPAADSVQDTVVEGGPSSDEASPWEHPLWHNATAMMRIYVCQHARRPPSWCEGPSELPANATLPDRQGPPLFEEDALWLAFMDKLDPANLTPGDVATVRRRATERRDPQAMEILGYIYAEGLSVERDYAEAYRWYGLAYLSGERRVRANMDVVWQQLQRYDVQGALTLTREFNALAEGEVPPGMVPLPGASENGQNGAEAATTLPSDSPPPAAAQ